jgi:hypothetical protein
MQAFRLLIPLNLSNFEYDILPHFIFEVWVSASVFFHVARSVLSVRGIKVLTLSFHFFFTMMTDWARCEITLVWRNGFGWCFKPVVHFKVKSRVVVIDRRNQIGTIASQGFNLVSQIDVRKKVYPHFDRTSVVSYILFQRKGTVGAF